MSAAVALLDANVLYPAPLRDLLLQLAVSTANLFQAKWSADIHREWIEALLRNEPHRQRATLERTRDLMDLSVRDCLVTGHESLVPTLHLPDRGDRHVLAAAITGQCDVIVTKNRKHFPDATLSLFGISTQDPDDFLTELLALAPEAFCDAVRTVRSRLTDPPYSVGEYLDILRQQGLESTVEQLQSFAETL